MEILRTENLKKYYDQNMVCVKALDGVDLSVEQGEFVAIVGTSGSGKSTLLHMLGGLDRPTAGTVLVDGKKIFDLKEEELTIFRRRKIGFVFQAYNLVPVLNVYENIVLPIQLDGSRVDEAFIEQIIEVLVLPKRKTVCRISSPAGSNRGWRSREHLPQNRLLSWQMSRPEIWIPRQVRMYWVCLR